jgi:hypothetical protein
MNHPDISTYNANLYYARMLKDAEDYRKAKKLTDQQRNGNVFSSLRNLFPFLRGKSIPESVSPAARQSV